MKSPYSYISKEIIHNQKNEKIPGTGAAVPFYPSLISEHMGFILYKSQFILERV